MTSRHPKPALSRAEVAAAFETGPWAERFPPILTIDQTAELLQVPKSTLYDWRSRGLLDHCSRRIGKRVRVFRNRLIHQIFNEGLPAHE